MWNWMSRLPTWASSTMLHKCSRTRSGPPTITEPNCRSSSHVSQSPSIFISAGRDA